jgi:DNA-directed RNA polymerase specialized sigma24 family protein/ribosome-associated translation inhibitor RaiA
VDSAHFNLPSPAYLPILKNQFSDYQNADSFVALLVHLITAPAAESPKSHASTDLHRFRELIKQRKIKGIASYRTGVKSRLNREWAGSLRGQRMNVHISYKVPKSPDLEKQINQNLEKLRRRLQVFKPDLIHLHAIVDERTGRPGFNVRLDLRLPSGDIAARVDADRAESAIKGAFEDLIEQVTKHKDRLRAQHRWPRQRRVAESWDIPQVPFEQTVAAVHLEGVSGEDISTYVNANFARLQRFVERELRYREANGELRPYQVQTQEVVGEAIANALGQEEKPEKVSLEPWLYRLSLEAIRNLTSRDGDGRNNVNLDQPMRSKQSSESDGTDEAILQYHQPDESIMAENLIANPAVATPEDSAATDEMINLIESALRGAGREDREAFLLFGIEGFTVDEIAIISGRPQDAVRKSINSARDLLRRNLPVRDSFKDKLLQHSKTA